MNKLLVLNSSDYIDELVEISKENFKSNPFKYEDFKNAIDSESFKVYLLLNEENKVCSYIYYSLVIDEGEIYQIATKKEYQRLGLGYLLLTQSLEEMVKNGMEKCFLEVRLSNLQAQNLYKKCGFTQYAIRKGYYEGEDACLYSKEFK